jgi:tRNA-uridine 2-sulfurtransferase
MRKKILVAMSGGVDSSASAWLLLQQGHDVAGITMNLQAAFDLKSRAPCAASQSVEDARRVCEHLGIRHFVTDFSEHLQTQVIDNFISEYRKGRTPNPCVQCNRHVKFGLLLEKAFSLGFDALATGHYASLALHQGRTVLKRCRDQRKDQTYFLYAVRNDAFSRIIFPLADMSKDEVRTLSGNAGLPVAQKPESQDICFIPHGSYSEFIMSRIGGMQPGDIVDMSGVKRGTHKGLAFYTIGQRGGLGIAAPAPVYVVAIDTVENRIVIGNKQDVQSRRLVASQINIHFSTLPSRAVAKIRYAHRPAACSFSVAGDRLNVEFDQPQEAITPGQSVVLYVDDMVIGGGIIDEVLHED